MEDFNGNNGESLFGARNENSVLFSLDSLSAIDNNAEGEGSNANSEASGLINLNMLSQMSNSEGGTGDEIESPMMASMTFNQVTTKKKKRNIALIISAFVVLLIGAGVGAYLLYQSGQEELKAQEAAAEKEKATQLAAQKAEEEKNAQLLDKIAQLEADANKRELDDKEYLAELQRLRQQQQAQAGADPIPNAGGKGKGSGTNKGNAAPSGGGDAAAPAKPAGPKADPAAIKAALAEANKKATKCAKGGTLNISVTLSGSGKATSVSSTGGTFKGTPSEKCVLTVYQKHNYPTFSGSNISVKYTVKL